MALGKSKREKTKTSRNTVESDQGTVEPAVEGVTDVQEVETSIEEMERFIQQAREHAGKAVNYSEQTEAPGPVRRKPGPAFTKKPGYIPGKSKKPIQSGATVVRNTYEKTNTGKSKAASKTLVTSEDTKRKGTRYVPSTKLKPKSASDSGEKLDGPPVINKQPALNRFAKTQATLAAIEAANKKKPSYIGNLRSRRIPEMNVPPPRPRVMPVLQPVNDTVDPPTQNKTTKTAKTPSGKVRKSRPTQPYGQARPAGMNKSLTKIWGNKKKRSSRKGTAGKGSTAVKSNTHSPGSQPAAEEALTEVEGYSTPVDISATESTIVITVNEGKPGAPPQGIEMLHHKKRWAAANTQHEEIPIEAQEAGEEALQEGMEVGEVNTDAEEGEVDFTEGEGVADENTDDVGEPDQMGDMEPEGESDEEEEGEVSVEDGEVHIGADDHLEDVEDIEHTQDEEEMSAES